MGLNKCKGNMYGFVNFTWNTIKGKCEHDCTYCYMKRFPQKEVRFVESELKTDLGENNIIFVGSSNDMWSENIPSEWILKTLEHCKKYKNTYLFQSKNPSRFTPFLMHMPDEFILCTTIETNIFRIASEHSKAPGIDDRAFYLKELGEHRYREIPIMLTIEPVLDFEPEGFIELIDDINPKWINIGADSGNNNLPEPSKEKLNELITYLQDKYTLTLKNNLPRLLK